MVCFSKKKDSSGMTLCGKCTRKCVERNYVQHCGGELCQGISLFSADKIFQYSRCRGRWWCVYIDVEWLRLAIKMCFQIGRSNHKNELYLCIFRFNTLTHWTLSRKTGARTSRIWSQPYIYIYIQHTTSVYTNTHSCTISPQMFSGLSNVDVPNVGNNAPMAMTKSSTTRQQQKIV